MSSLRNWRAQLKASLGAERCSSDGTEDGRFQQKVLLSRARLAWRRRDDGS